QPPAARAGAGRTGAEERHGRDRAGQVHDQPPVRQLRPRAGHPARPAQLAPHPVGRARRPLAVPDGRVVLLAASPRVAPGLLTWEAWQRLASADAVLLGEPAPGWPDALTGAGIPWERVDDPPRGRAARLLAEAGPGREVVWLGSADGDPGLADALAEQ